MAIVRPPTERLDDTNLEAAPVARSLTMALIGFVAAVWALASLVNG